MSYCSFIATNFEMPEQESRTKSELENHIPLVLRPGQEQNWLEDQKKKTESKTIEQAKPEAEPKQETANLTEMPVSEVKGQAPLPDETVQEQPSQSNSNGWNKNIS